MSIKPLSGSNIVVDLVISAGFIITMESSGSVLTNHSVVIDQGRIIDILPNDAANKYAAKQHVHRPEHAILPGFVNAHGHSAMTLFRGLADDLALMDWLNHHIWPAEQRCVDSGFTMHGTELAIMEMIRSGTTTFCDQYFFPESAAKAAEKNFLRCRLNTPVLDFPSAWAQSADEYIDKGLALYEQYQSHPLISVALGPHAPYTVSDKPLIKIRDASEKHHIGIHMHLNETAHEVKEAVRLTGMRPIERLHQLGLLSERFQAVHMTQISDAEITRLSESGSQVIHCPESNLKLASGLCPVHRLQEAGINVALGTDGAASNNDLNMVSELRTASLIAKLVDHDATALPAYEALKLATINGATALGIDDEVGSVTIGKSADLISIDLSAPELQPLYNPVSQIVFSAGRENISDSWVAGKQLMNQRQLSFMDEGEIINNAKLWQQKIANIT